MSSADELKKVLDSLLESNRACHKLSRALMIFIQAELEQPMPCILDFGAYTRKVYRDALLMELMEHLNQAMK